MTVNPPTCSHCKEVLEPCSRCGSKPGEACRTKKGLVTKDHLGRHMCVLPYDGANEEVERLLSGECL